MYGNKGIDYTELRKEVAKLYKYALTKRISVRDALSQFPKDCNDSTIIASWHALCHLEADEDIRAKDELYRKEQDEFLNFIEETLSKGENLPENIINEYKPFHPDSLISGTTKISSILNKLKRFLCC